MRSRILTPIKLGVVQVLKHRRRRPGRPRVLISYIVRPFLGISHHHPNELDARCIYEIFDEAEWDITVVDYRRRHVGGYYDLVFGFGTPLATCIEEKRLLRAVYYATGAPFYWQSAGSIRSLRRYLNAGGKATPGESMAYMRYTYTKQPLQMVMCDLIICLGGEYNLREYARLAPALPLSPIVTPVGSPVEMTMKRASSGGFLWFGGNGPIHKGLDLCMSICGETGDYLAVAGTTSSINIVKTFPIRGNFEHHGFLQRGSDSARAAIERCRFVIHPSASEGEPTSVVAAVLDGNLLPIVSRECNMSNTEDLILIERLDLEGVRAAVIKAKSLSPEEIIERVRRIRERFLQLYSKHHVKSKLSNHLEKFII